MVRSGMSMMGREDAGAEVEEEGKEDDNEDGSPAAKKQKLEE